MTAKKLGIALSAGGARGYAHLGVLKALAEHGIPIDAIAGTSAGSFAGGAVAAGMSVGDLIELGSGLGWMTVAGFSYSPRGMLSNEPLGRFIESKFPVTRFEDLKIPFAAVACDLRDGSEVLLRDSGSLATAIRASCAIPGVFVPVEDGEGRPLVDGGVVSPMPTRAVQKLGAEKIVAVDVITCGTGTTSVPSTLIGTFVQSAMMLIRTASRNQHYRADIVIEPQVAHIRPDEIGRRDELIELGYKAAIEKIDDAKRLAEDAAAA